MLFRFVSVPTIHASMLEWRWRSARRDGQLMAVGERNRRRSCEQRREWDDLDVYLRRKAYLERLHASPVSAASGMELDQGSSRAG